MKRLAGLLVIYGWAMLAAPASAQANGQPDYQRQMQNIQQLQTQDMLQQGQVQSQINQNHRMTGGALPDPINLTTGGVPPHQINLMPRGVNANRSRSIGQVYQQAVDRGIQELAIQAEDRRLAQLAADQRSARIRWIGVLAIVLGAATLAFRRFSGKQRPKKPPPRPAKSMASRTSNRK